MDIDIAKPGLEDRIEDDIIDFDTDMVDSNHEIQKHDHNIEIVDKEMHQDDDTANHYAYGVNVTIGEDVDFDLNDVEDIAYDMEPADYEVSEAPELQKQEQDHAAKSSNESTEKHDDDVGSLNATNEHSHDVPDDHASIHEIDYEFEDHMEPDELRNDVNAETTSLPAESGTVQEASAVLDNESYEASDNINVPDQDALVEHAEGEVDTLNHDNQAQYEEEEEEEEEVPGQDEATALDEPEVADTDDLVETSGRNEEPHGEEDMVEQEEIIAPKETEPDHEATENTEDTKDYGHDLEENGPEEQNEDETADVEHAEYAEHQATGEDLNGKAGDDFPAITVQYKGDEFPLFSTTANGFFADTSVLDEPLEKLLAGLRSELENEIAEDDDLVFQVDELGLEVAEVRKPTNLDREVADGIKQTTQGELMSNVTFRQVLEIFDLLVKNQDPDGSRTLYTYLFTKPNTEKRLESLIESAMAGKGLDEVIHLFQSPMPAGTSMLETGITIDDVHEELDNFGSPVDEEHPSETKGAEADDEYPEEEHLGSDTSVPEGQQVGGHEEIGHDAFEQVTAVTETEISAEAASAEANPETADETDVAAVEEGFEQNGKPTSLSSSFICCYYPEFCLCAPCVTEYLEDHERDEAEYRQTLKVHDVAAHSLPFERSFLDLSRFKHAPSRSDFSIAFSYNEADDFFPAHADSETDTFTNLELDESAGVNDDVDLDDGVGFEEEVDIESEVVHTQTNDTSTTTTLQGEDEAGPINIDLGASSAEVEAGENAKSSEEDDLDEIDWRDEPGADDEEPSTPSAAGKRSRGDDDDDDAEDEQGMLKKVKIDNCIVC
ncbi:hypothetical protein F66182_10098 [Fusarium sp. NRRL 66182]|nr:hypothetical protein F66182_10098 [Fusarium sp. NRRL 66182]